MRIDTDLTVMVILPIRTPHSLEVKHVEVHINIVLFDQFNREFAFIMSKRTILLVFTRRAPHLEIGRTELGLILVRVIEFLDSVVCPIAVILLRTTLYFANHLWADFGLVRAQWPSAVFVIVMVEGTAFKVMVLRVLLTLVYFEGEEIEEHYGLTHTDLTRVEAAAMRPWLALMVALIVTALVLLWKLFINRYLLLELILLILRGS